MAINKPKTKTGNTKMQLTINSKILNKKITFSIPGNSYVFVDINGQPGTLGKQICAGGYTLGDTLSYSGQNQSDFESICHRWYRAYVKNVRDF